MLRTFLLSVCLLGIWSSSSLLAGTASKPISLAAPVPISDWTAKGDARLDQKVALPLNVTGPALRIHRVGNAPCRFVSSAVALGEGRFWRVGAWMKIKGMLFQDPSFQSALYAKWLDESGKPLESSPELVFGSYDIQRKRNISTRSGTKVSFDFHYFDRVLTRPQGAKQLQLVFTFGQGSAVAWLAGANVRMDMGAGNSGKVTTSDLKRPQIRLRNGSKALSDTSSNNVPLFTVDEPVTFTVLPPVGTKQLRLRVTDTDGGLLWTDDLTFKSKTPARVKVTVPADVLGDVMGQCLILSVANGSSVATLQFGILPVRKPLTAKQQDRSAFGMVGSDRDVLPRGIAMLKLAGVQWVRQRGLQFYQPDPKVPQDISKHYVLKQWKTLEDNGIRVLDQIYMHPKTKWALDPKLLHRGHKPHVLADPFARWITQAGQQAPILDHVKLLNERDRDPRPKYLAAYADLMRKGYKALKAVRPDTIISVEGGLTLDIVRKLLDMKLYDYLDVIDHHLYGDYNAVLDLQARLDLVRKAGYHQPVIASEFGVVPGSGNASLTSRDVSNGLIRNTACFLGVGGDRLFYFIWGHHKAKKELLFGATFLTAGPEDQPTDVLFTYAKLSQLLEGAKLIDKPTVDHGLWRVTFHKDDSRIDVVWANQDVATGVWKNSPSLRVIEALGREQTFTPRPEGMQIVVGSEPLIIVSDLATQFATLSKPGLVVKPSLVNSEGGSLSNPIVQLPAEKNWQINPVMPRGWDIQRNAQNQWVTHPAPGIAQDTYTLRWVAKDSQGKTAALAMSHVELGNVLELEVRGDPQSRGRRVHITVHNRGSSAWDGQLQLLSPVAGLSMPQMAAWDLKLPAHKKIKLTWKMDKPYVDDQMTDPVFTARLFSGDRFLSQRSYRTTFRSVPFVKHNIRADGVLDDWVGVPSIKIPYGRFISIKSLPKPTSDADQSATVRLAYNKGGIAVAVEVRDDIHWNDNPPDFVWAGDAIEFCLGIRPGGIQEVPKEYFKFALGLGPKGPMAYAYERPAGRRWARGVPTNCDYFVKRTKDGRTIYEFVLRFGPLHMSPKDGITFALAVDEADKSQIRTGFLPWFGGVARQQSATPQGWFTFQPAR